MKKKLKKRKKNMMSTNFSKKLEHISKVIAGRGDGISYILDEGDNYTIGSKKYSEKIAQYLNQTLETWKGSEANLANIKKKKGRNKQNKRIKHSNDVYLWKIPITENNLQFVVAA